MLHMLGEALVCQQAQLVLPKERQGMQEQHTIAHVEMCTNAHVEV